MINEINRLSEEYLELLTYKLYTDLHEDKTFNFTPTKNKLKESGKIIVIVILYILVLAFVLVFLTQLKNCSG
jgi:hypothetical protein